MAIRNSYNFVVYIYFDAILKHSIFITFFDTKHSITNGGKTTHQERWFVSINNNRCGIWLLSNNKEFKTRRIAQSEGRCFGSIFETEGTGDVYNLFIEIV